MDNAKDKDSSTLRKRGFTAENAGTIRFTQKQLKVVKELAAGATYQEAIVNAEVIIREWIDTARELGRPIPEPHGRLVYA